MYIFQSTILKNKRMAQMTQEELSQKTGISLSIIKNIESSRKVLKPTDNYLHQICNVLDIDIMDLFIRDTQIISMFTNKGGAGKTTICANMSYMLTEQFNKRILIIDADQQMNLTKYFNMLDCANADSFNLYKAFMNQESVQSHIRNTGYPNLDIVISHFDVGTIEPQLPFMSYKESRFLNIVTEVKNSGYYDYIFVDCNPSLSIFNSIILSASDKVLIPLEPSAFGLGGIENVVDYVHNIQQSTVAANKHHLEIAGIIVNKYSKVAKMPEMVTRVAEELYKSEGYIFKTRLPQDANIGNSQTECKPIGVNYKRSKFTLSLFDVCQELISRVEK